MKGNPDAGNHTEEESSNVVDPETSAFNVTAQQAPTNSGESSSIAEPAESPDDRGNLPTPDHYELRVVRISILLLCLFYLCFIIQLVANGAVQVFLWLFALDIINLADEARAFALHIVRMRQARGRQTEDSV